MASFFRKKQNNNTPRRRQDSPAKERATEASLEQRYAFRRNRTLTGSASSQVVGSTNETKAQLKSTRVQTHELVQQRRHIGATLLLIVTGALVLFALISQFTAGVVIKTQDASIQPDPVYEKIIQDYLSNQPVERLRFLLNTQALGDYLQINAPEVAAVAVEGSAGFGKSSFIITMRRPITGWSINSQQQYVDETGTAFARNYFPTPAVQIVDNSGVQVTSGQAIASNRFLSFVGRVVGLVKMQGYAVKQIVIPSGTTRQVDLYVDGIAYPVKFSVDRGAGEQAEDMGRALRWLIARGQTPQYLDVRVSGRAFYQ